MVDIYKEWGNDAYIWKEGTWMPLAKGYCKEYDGKWEKDKLYGYHRLSDPKITYQNGSGMKVCNWSEITKESVNKPVGMIGRKDIELEPTEPNKY